MILYVFLPSPASPPYTPPDTKPDERPTDRLRPTENTSEGLEDREQEDGLRISRRQLHHGLRTCSPSRSPSPDLLRPKWISEPGVGGEVPGSMCVCVCTGT